MNKRKSIKVIHIFILCTICFFLFYSNMAFPFVLKRGEKIVIEPDEIINEDMYIRASEVEINGTINGDLWIVGGVISINGQISGNVYIIGSSISFGGVIVGGIKVVGKDIFISAEVGKDAFLLGSQIIINRDTFVGGDVVFAGKEVDVEGIFKKNMYGAGKKIIINSSIDGESKFWAGDLELRSRTKIGGGVFYRSNKNAVVFPGAEIKGKIMREAPDGTGPRRSLFSYLLKINPYIWMFVRFLSGLIVGIFFILFSPRVINRVANTVYEKPIPSFLWGLLIAVIVPIFSIVAFVFIVSIPVALILISIYTMVVSAGIVGFEIFIGRFLLRKNRFDVEKKVLLISFLVGLAILSLVRFIPVVGPILLILVLIIGSGGVVSAFQGMRKRGEIDIRT